MSEVHCYTELDALNNALDEAEQQARISDDALRQALSKIFFDLKLEKVPSDPFAPEYQQLQLDLYEKISGNTYSTHFEATPFNFAHEIAQPYPYGTRSTQTVGDTLIGYGHIIKNLPLRPDAKVLEVGSGFGSLSYHLAPMHVDLTCLDIDRRLLDFVSHRVAAFNHRITFIQSDIHEFQPPHPYDLVIFHESFHHCYDHLRVMSRLCEIVAPGGTVVFAAEPLLDAPDRTLPYPWGLRMDGLSLRCVRRFGWIELGFLKAYFFEMLERFGWSFEERTIPGHHYTHMILAQRK